MKDPEQPSDSRFPLTNNAAKSSFAAADARSAAPASKKTARPRTWKTYALWTAASLFCITGAMAGVVFNRFYKTDIGRTIVNNIGSNPLKVLLTGDPMTNFDYTKFLPAEKQHTINVLVLGCDHDYDDRTQQPILTTPGRSDSILIAHIDFDNRSVKCMTIPRDTAVEIPGHRGLHKINAAHEFGDNPLTIQTIKERFGIDTDYYVTLDFESFQKVVNAIGGVDVMVHKPLNYDDNWGNLHVHLQPGMQHLNGYKAMGYVRIRHSDSDIMRSERQHEFIEALRAQITTPKNFLKLPDVMNAVTRDLHYSPELNNNALLSIAKFVKELPKEKIELVTMPNFEGRSYCYIYQDKARKAIADIFYNGMEGMVQLDLPNWDQVAALNSGGLRLNDAGESVGGEVGEGRRGRRRRHTRVVDATTPRDDNGDPIVDSPKEGETMSADVPATTPDENTADGHKARRNRKSGGATDTSGEGKTDKTEGGSPDTGSKDTGSAKDGGKDTGSKSGEGKSDGGAKEADSKGDSGDKSKDTGGDKGDTKTGGAAGDTL